MTTVLITGANRGLGLALATAYAAGGAGVIATARAPAATPALAALALRHPGRVQVQALDVTDHTAIERLAAALAPEAIDVLIANAGIYGDRAGLDTLDFAVWAEVMHTNLFGTVKLVQAFRPHLGASMAKQIAVISSQRGSIGGNREGGLYAYRTSKAALNAAVKSLAIDLAREGITVVSIHPGWVRTAMGGDAAPLTAENSAAATKALLARLTLADSGRFLNYDGVPLPW